MTKISPASLIKEIEKYEGDLLPPVHLWNPPICKNINMRIDREGRWYFMDSIIGRERMVRLFSRVLRLDDDGYYYLVTPVEKIKLEVEDKPFLIVDFSIAGRDKEQIISFKTNTNDHFLLDEHHPLRVEIKSSTKEPSPYVLVRENLEGLLSRNVYYKLVDISVTKKLKHKKIVGIWSRNQFFELGEP